MDLEDLKDKLLIIEKEFEKHGMKIQSNYSLSVNQFKEEVKIKCIDLHITIFPEKK